MRRKGGTGLLGLITERLSAPNLRMTLQSPARTRSDRQHRIAHFYYLFDLSHKKAFFWGSDAKQRRRPMGRLLGSIRREGRALYSAPAACCGSPPSAFCLASRSSPVSWSTA